MVAHSYCQIAIAKDDLGQTTVTSNNFSSSSLSCNYFEKKSEKVNPFIYAHPPQIWFTKICMQSAHCRQKSSNCLLSCYIFFQNKNNYRLHNSVTWYVSTCLKCMSGIFSWFFMNQSIEFIFEKQFYFSNKTIFILRKSSL